MVYQSQLQRNTGVLDPLIWSHALEDSYFFYMGYRTVKNFFRYFKDVAPITSNNQWGGITDFKVPIIADKMGPIQLTFNVSPLTATPPASPAVLSHNARYVDFLGFFAWQKIEFNYGTNDIYTLYPEECYLRTKQSLDIVPQDAVKELVAGERSTMRRELLATTTQEMIVDLPFPHTRGTSRWIEIMQLASEARISVYWQPLANVAQIGNATAPVSTISNPMLRVTYVHLDGDERDDNTGRTEDTDGVIRLFEEMRFEKLQLLTGQGSSTIANLLHNFRTATKCYTFFIRNYNDIYPPPGTDPTFTNLQPVTDYWLEASDGKIHEPVEDRYYRFYLAPLYHRGPTGDLIYEWTFAMEPDDALNCSGSLNLGNTSNLTLNIDLPSVLTQNVELCVACKEYNTVQHTRGDMLKNFK